MDFEKIRRVILELCTECVKHARQAVYPTHERAPLAVRTMHMGQAFTCVRTAQAYYSTTDLQDGEWQDFDTFCRQFDELLKEFTTSVETDHSLQWSGLELEKLEGLHEYLTRR